MENSHLSRHDVNNEINSERWLCKTVDRTFKGQVRKETKLKCYLALRISVLL
jgi:hypothetical protein